MLDLLTPRAFYLPDWKDRRLRPSRAVHATACVIHAACAVLLAALLVIQALRPPAAVGDFRVSTEVLSGYDCSMLARHTTTEFLGAYPHCGMDDANTPGILAATFTSVLARPADCLSSLPPTGPAPTDCYCLVDDSVTASGTSIRIEFTSCPDCLTYLSNGTRPCTDELGPADADGRALPCFRELWMRLRPPPVDLSAASATDKPAGHGHGRTEHHGRPLGRIAINGGFKLRPRCSLLADRRFVADPAGFVADALAPARVCGLLDHMPPYACTRPRPASAIEAIATSYAVTHLCFVVLAAVAALILRRRPRQYDRHHHYHKQRLKDDDSSDEEEEAATVVSSPPAADDVGDPGHGGVIAMRQMV